MPEIKMNRDCEDLNREYCYVQYIISRFCIYNIAHNTMESPNCITIKESIRKINCFLVIDRKQCYPILFLFLFVIFLTFNRFLFFIKVINIIVIQASK